MFSKIIYGLKAFRSAEQGGAGAFSLMLLVSILAIGGYAVDVSNVMTNRTQLQMTADTVAHAALYTREFNTEADAKTAALAISITNLPVAYVGTVIKANDIVFGDWNATTRVFTPNAASRKGVQVTARENTSNGNPVKTFLLKTVGFSQWDLEVTSTVMTYHPTCLLDGFVAEGIVDIQSNNTYLNGFCIHSNTYVKLSSNNTFEAGTIVSMPNLADLQLPNSGFKTNIGLAAALREGSWNIRIIPRLAYIISTLQTPGSTYYPDFITNSVPVVLTHNNIDIGTLTPGRIYTYTCGSSGTTLTISNNVVVIKALIVTDCKIKFSNGVVLIDSVIATTSTSAQSMTATSGLVVGINDNCAVGGGTQLLTMGSMSYPSAIEVNGSQLIAYGDISFAANGSGLKGASFVAGGKISGTSNMTMSQCNNQDAENVNVEYFTMVD